MFVHSESHSASVPSERNRPSEHWSLSHKIPHHAAYLWIVLGITIGDLIILKNQGVGACDEPYIDTSVGFQISSLTKTSPTLDLRVGVGVNEAGYTTAVGILPASAPASIDHGLAKLGLGAKTTGLQLSQSTFMNLTVLLGRLTPYPWAWALQSGSSGV